MLFVRALPVTVSTIRNKFIANMQEEEKVKIAATRQGSEERLKIIDAAIKEEESAARSAGERLDDDPLVTIEHLGNCHPERERGV